MNTTNRFWHIAAAAGLALLAVLLTTFVLTVLVDLTVAISVGMVLPSFLFIRRMATVTSVNVVTPFSTRMPEASY